MIRQIFSVGEKLEIKLTLITNCFLAVPKNHKSIVNSVRANVDYLRHVANVLLSISRNTCAIRDEELVSSSNPLQMTMQNFSLALQRTILVPHSAVECTTHHRHKHLAMKRLDHKPFAIIFRAIAAEDAHK